MLFANYWPKLQKKSNKQKKCNENNHFPCNFSYWHWACHDGNCDEGYAEGCFLWCILCWIIESKKAWLGDSGPRFGLFIFMFLLHSDKIVILLAALYEEVLAVDDLMRANQ